MGRNNGRESTENQLAQLRKFCADRGWPIVAEFVDHATGKRSDREQFTRMLADHKGKPTIILALEKRAAARVRDLAVKNIGNSVGIVLNGEVVVAPRIVGRTGEIAIQADFSSAEAEAIAAAFNRRGGKRRTAARRLQLHPRLPISSLKRSQQLGVFSIYGGIVREHSDGNQDQGI